MKLVLGTRTFFFLLISVSFSVSYLFSGNLSAQGFLYSKESSSPRDDAVPGLYFFRLGVDEIRKQDYRYAITLYKIAASWAYKPAEYNLGVIFVKGEGGVPEDRPQGLAWLTLAAERSDKTYVAARDRVRSALPPEEVAKADALVLDLNKTYGDEHALPRAKARWRDVRNNATGSHLGFVGNLQVGSMNAQSGNPMGTKGSGKLGTNGGISNAAAGLTGGEYVAGSVAYRELRETDNPYDPRFDVGTVTVGNVVTLGKDDVGKKNSEPAPTETSKH
jgi:hypothetical protein